MESSMTWLILTMVGPARGGRLFAEWMPGGGGGGGGG